MNTLTHHREQRNHPEQEGSHFKTKLTYNEPAMKK
jgi:hypothetical protein